MATNENPTTTDTKMNEASEAAGDKKPLSKNALKKLAKGKVGI